MIPVDAQIWTEADVRRDGFSLETVLGEINSRGAGVKIALIDASRRNPFERRFRSFSAGLAPVIAPNGTLVMYSAALSSVISRQWQRSQPVRAGIAQGNPRSRPDGRRNAEPHPRRRHPRLAQRAGAVDFVLAGRGFFLHSGRRRPRPSRRRHRGRRDDPALRRRPRPPRRSANRRRHLRSPPPPRHRPTCHPPPPKPVEVTIPPPTPPASRAKTAVALADDPTIKSLTAKLDDNPDDAGALYRRGQVYASKGAYDLAIKDFDDSLRLNPKDVEAYNNRCWARTVIGDLQAALKDCNEALRLRPNFVDALDSRGLVNLKSGQTKNAIADFDAALQINPRLTSSLYGRGLAKKRNGSISEGDLDIANAKAMDPNIVKEFADYGVQ